MQLLLLLLKITLVLCAIQAVNCRCVCGPADTTCLNNCECINVHWPGTTFEDGVRDELDEAEDPVITDTKEDIGSNTLARVTATDTTKTTTEADFIGALISAIFNPPPSPSIVQETTAASNLALGTEIPVSTSVPVPDSATPLLPLSEIASMLNLSNPLLTTSKMLC
ncbi:hypothetical protein [Parasitella parasitica]|uniref:Uncharacterized protein n=1 Tax=Parasitella parasitica TaxID=35722 RepID=A0A0B7NTG3_9FUNG|nr:hypothetical protein [Parasitella parasitica]